MMNGPHTWFRGAVENSVAEREFVERLRALAPGWRALGLSAEGSESLRLAIPFLGVELPHLSAQLRWLWIKFFDAEGEFRVEGTWGDLDRYDDWGPTDGDLDVSEPQGAGVAERLATRASEWVMEQANRPVVREDWDGFRPSSKWTFADNGTLLWNTRHRWRSTPPIRRSLEQASTGPGLPLR